MSIKQNKAPDEFKLSGVQQWQALQSLVADLNLVVNDSGVYLPVCEARSIFVA